MGQLIDTIWNYFTNDLVGKTAFAGIVSTVVGGVILALFQIFTGIPRSFLRSFLSRLSLANRRSDVKVFEVITEPAMLFPRIYGKEDDPRPLAHYRIPYQPRDPTRNIQNELSKAFHDSRYLLITGRNGVGKTREATTLIYSLMNEGYRVVRIITGWLDAPKEFLYLFSVQLAQRRRQVPKSRKKASV